MKLADSSKQKIEDFFRFYLEDERFQLPAIEIYVGKVAKRLTGALHIHGITIGKKIFILPDLLFCNSSKDNALPDDLIVHEIMHVVQYRKEGFWIFLYKYFNEYRKNLQKKNSFDRAARGMAYLEISYEREARDAATNFLKWKKRKTAGSDPRFSQKKLTLKL